MSRDRASTSASLLDRLQAHGQLPVVNPHKPGSAPALPAAPGAARAVAWFTLTLIALAAIVAATMILAGSAPTFIYSEF
jgi:hypothetical protein